MTTRRFRTAAVLGSIMLLAACSAAKAPITPNPPPDTVQATRQKAIEIASAVQSAGEFVVRAGRATYAAYDAKLITLEQREKVRLAIIALEPKAKAAIDIASTVTSEPELKSTIAALVQAFTPLEDALRGTGQQSVLSLLSDLVRLYAVAKAYINPGEPVMAMAGGVR